MKPTVCNSIPEMNYVCSTNYKHYKDDEDESEVYQDYLRYASCLDLDQRQIGCGKRELYLQVEPEN